MFSIKQSLLRAVAVAAILGSLATAAPAFAAPEDGSSPSGPPNSTVQMDNSGNVVATTPDTSATPSLTPTSGHKHMHGPSPEEMRAHIEERIKTLHDKLGITQDEEASWNNVAEAMRENETAIGDLIHERHEHPKNMTAVEDLESYQKIAQAHADGLKKVVSTFESLYDSMPDAQKKNADKVFGSFQKHDGHKHSHKQ